MSLEAWQIALRRQLGGEETFALTNIGDRPIFSEFHVTNPKSGNTYRVAIRGSSPGSNFRSCPDFTTNTLGTCKHVEFTLAQLERRHQNARAGRCRSRRAVTPGAAGEPSAVTAAKHSFRQNMRPGV